MSDDPTADAMLARAPGRSPYARRKHPEDLGSGTRDGTKFLRDDATWQATSGGVALEGTTAPPATAGASALGTAVTASHADHTHQTGTHTHVEADVTSLVADLAGKAATVHTHAESDVTALVADLAALPKGRIASTGTQNTTTGSITTTELAYGAIANLAVTTVSGRRYRVSFTLYEASTVAGDTVFIRLRDGLGSAPTNTSALLYEANSLCGAANVQVPVSASFEWTPGAVTAHHLGLFALRNSGTGTVTVGSATAGRLSDLIVEDIGT